MKLKRESLWPTAFLWAGIAFVAFGDATLTMVVGAIFISVGLNLGTEEDYKRRLDALDAHYRQRLEEMRSDSASDRWVVEQTIADFQRQSKAD